MNNVFICTKPVHLVSIIDIAEQTGLDSSCLIVVNSFKDSDEFYQKCKANIDSLGFTYCHYFDTELEASKFINSKSITTVYTNWDLEIWYKNLSSVDVITYDDGFFSYLKDFGRGGYISHALRFIKGILQPQDRCLLSHGNLTRGGYFFYPKYHRNVFPYYNRNRFKYSGSFIELIDKHSSKLEKVYDISGLCLSKYKDSNIVLYLTSSNIDKEELKVVSDIDCDYILIKPHPHIKNIGNYFDSFSCIIDNNVPAEVIFSKLVDSANNVTLVHSNSSIALHYSNLVDGLSFINLCRDKIKKKKFVKMESFLKSGLY